MENDMNENDWIEEIKNNILEYEKDLLWDREKERKEWMERIRICKILEEIRKIFVEVYCDPEQWDDVRIESAYSLGRKDGIKSVLDEYVGRYARRIGE